MRRALIVTLACCLLGCLLAAGAALAADAPKAGQPLPKVDLPSPQTEAGQRMLGLTGDKDTFDPAQVQAKVLVLEIYNVYCEHCQHEAPTVNKLWEKIQKDDLAGQIKFLGIAAKNSSLEVKAWRSNFDVDFPLAPDPGGDAAKALGVEATPFFIVAKLDGNGGGELVYARPGALPHPGVFLKFLQDQLK